MSAVASTAPIAELVLAMGAATDPELVGIGQRVSYSARVLIKSLSEQTGGPIAELFVDKAPELQMQQQTLQAAIEAVRVAKDRASLVAAITYLQSTIETTEAFYRDDGQSPWHEASKQFADDVGQVLIDTTNHVIKPALKYTLYQLRWWLIGAGVLLAALAVIKFRVGK